MDLFVEAVPAHAVTDAPLLKVKDVRKSFGSAKVLDGVSFDVAARQITGLIGPNGAGKTTLFNLIAGIDEPDSGSIELRGRAIAGLSPPARVALGVSRTFQEIRLFNSLTAIENVMVGCRGQGEGRGEEGLAATVFLWRRSAAHERRIRARAAELLELVDLAALADRRPGELSYGQQKRVGIARALATGQDLLCLDEPAAGLDPEAARDLVNLIRKLSENVGTILLIEHNLELVRDVCRQVLFLDAGRIVVEGAPEQVMADERVWRAFMGV
jgi:ABC-type branched-subunit amino acid transport system ATPase component